MASPLELAQKCLTVLNNDRELLELIDNYARGNHCEPYIPDAADAEYRMLAKRCTTNLTGFVVGTSAQAMYVDGFRRKTTMAGDSDGIEPEWEHWHRSRLDARQSAIYRGALTFGHAFVVTEKTPRGVVSRGLSALNTAAVYNDPASDEAPLMALTVNRWPKHNEDPAKVVYGTGTAWDEKYVYDVNFKATMGKSLQLTNRRPHGASVCPVTRFTAFVDLEGRTTGVVEPMIPLQDRLNQSIFDLLVIQSGGAFKVRTVTGMAPPVQMKPVYERPQGTVDNPNDRGDVVGSEPVIDPMTGEMQPKAVQISARRLLMAEDPDTRFGTLDETPLSGYIESIEMTFRQIAALTQTPPHHLLGQIANLSAEALEAAETSLQRKVQEFQMSFGESWERVFRIAAELDGDSSLKDDTSGEVLWRDMEQRNMAQAGDALSKMRNDLEIPAEGLWSRVPGVTQAEIAHWRELKKEDDSTAQLADAISRASTVERPTFRQPKPVQEAPTSGVA